VSFLLSLSDTKTGKFKKAYGGHRSALSDLLGQCEVVSSAAFVKKMKRLYQGLNRRSVRARGENGGKLGEGKDPLPSELCRAICTWLLADGSKESIFAHCFLTLTWNLMCRSKNTVCINRRHLSWSGDAMAVNFAHTKSNMEGSDAGHKRHIYANPKMAEICSVLSTGRYLAAFPAEASGRLFGGQRQYDRFRKMLQAIFEKHKEEEVLRLGIDPNYIGVHSIRKGAATYCCSGATRGPSYAAVCDREFSC
jgi:hypothetical protein